MRVIHARNVNDAWGQAVQLMLEEGRNETSRAGNVLVMPCPVMTVYAKPCERVLFDPIRDANPFFHLFEAMWMLAGHNDVAYLTRFVKDFDRFAERDGTIHGAYGFRWREHFGFDQLETIIIKLQNSPGDRQAVLQMWDAGYAIDLTGNWKDRPCNTHAYFRIRDGYLDMTICCRSNDILWGAYGANAVHFSFLQEYMAGRIGCNVGLMYQLSNNWHAYEARFRPYVEAAEDADTGIVAASKVYGPDAFPTPLGTRWEDWDNDLAHFMMNPDGSFNNYWFKHVLAPLLHAHTLYKEKQYEPAFEATKACGARDWRIACQEWIVRRMNRTVKSEVIPQTLKDENSVANVYLRSNTGETRGGE